MLQAMTSQGRTQLSDSTKVPPLERESYQTWVAGGNLNPGAGTSVFYVSLSLFYYWFALFFDGTF